MRKQIQPYFGLVAIIFLTIITFTNYIFAEENTEAIKTTQKASDSTRIVIKASGPVKFNSYWLENPYRLVIEFKSRNIIGNIDKEVTVNQGVIKKITSTYFGGSHAKVLKTLTFELTDKAPYKIWQEGNAILLDIQAPLEASGFSIDTKVAIVKTESSNMVKRLEAMDSALKQTQETQRFTSVVIGGAQASNKTLKQAGSTKVEQGKVILAEPIKARRKWLGIILRLVGLVSISGLGFLLWAKFIVARTKKLNERARELKLQLEEKDKTLEQVEIIRKTIEKTAIAKEKEYEQLKLELQEKSRLFEQEVAIRSEKEKALSEKEKEYEHLKETSESLKDVLVKRGIARELTLPESKGELWILGKSPERRNLPRLALTKDFHNTVILKLELPGSLKQIKSFAENISSDGLCFETKGELDEKNSLNLRLFFYGSKVPNFRTQGWIVWKRTQDSKNYYGITFEGLSEKVKSELQNYIEANIPRG